MNILFLDVDCVLNSKQHFMMTKDAPKVSEDIDPVFQMRRDVNDNNMFALKYLLDNIPDLKIVISSAWRNFYSIEQFKELFKIFKLDGEKIIDKTPKMFSSQRIHEIHSWLDDHKEVNQWIALDDHPIFNLEDSDKVNEHLTDSWVGLTMLDVFKIIKKFNSKFEEPEMGI